MTAETFRPATKRDMRALTRHLEYTHRGGGWYAVVSLNSLHAHTCRPATGYCSCGDRQYRGALCYHVRHIAIREGVDITGVIDDEIETLREKQKDTEVREAKLGRLLTDAREEIDDAETLATLLDRTNEQLDGFEDSVEFYAEQIARLEATKELMADW